MKPADLDAACRTFTERTGLMITPEQVLAAANFMFQVPGQELEALRAKERQREADRAKGLKAAQAARRVLKRCPRCSAITTARQRRKGCVCGYRWPAAELRSKPA